MQGRVSQSPHFWGPDRGSVTSQVPPSSRVVRVSLVWAPPWQTGYGEGAAHMCDVDASHFTTHVC